MTASQRIALNALATYGRTIFGMALGLFSSRWVLQSLGAVDYGLMSVVGGLIGFVTFFNVVSMAACTRFFALAIGRRDADETNQWFNTALSILTIVPLILVLAAWPVGEWAVRSFLNVPPDRLATACWVFRFSLVAAFWSLSSTPYLAMYAARQNIAEFSLWGIGASLVNFFFVLWLTTYRGDAWLVYSGVTVAIVLGIGAGQVLRARHVFRECRIDFSRWFDWTRIRQMASYAGWAFFGAFGWVAQSQGLAVVLNKFLPPARYQAVNASYAIGGTVANYTQTLSTSLMDAFLPEITAAEGRGDRPSLIRQMLREARFSVLLSALFSIPLFLEVPYVLRLWLRDPPASAALFCRAFLIAFLLTRLMAGFDAAICATGRIKWYEIVMGGCSMLAVPIACVLLKCQGGLVGICLLIVALAGIQLVGGACFARHLVGCRLSCWMKEVVMPSVLLVGATSACAVLSRQLARSAPDWQRLLLVVAVSAGVCSFLGWFLLVTAQERRSVGAQIAGALKSRGPKGR